MGAAVVEVGPARYAVQYAHSVHITSSPGCIALKFPTTLCDKDHWTWIDDRLEQSTIHVPQLMYRYVHSLARCDLNGKGIAGRVRWRVDFQVFINTMRPTSPTSASATIVNQDTIGVTPSTYASSARK